MSKHKKAKQQKVEGLQTIARVEHVPVAEGAKVTGINLGKILHLLSLDAEKNKLATQVTIGFADDGHLQGLIVRQTGSGSIALTPGDWVIESNGQLWAEKGEVFDREGLVAL